jgi:hypothetical protein
MTRRLSLAVAAGVLALALGSAAPARAQSYGQPYTPLNRFSYYPYYYFPHSYWPGMSPRWPEPVPAQAAGYCPKPPPAYMAYPPFIEPMWRYELWQPQSYYRGFHFWLDQM